MAGCCDAERGERCRSGGTVTFQRTGITLLTLLLWLEFSPSSPGDDLTLFTPRRDAGGCSELVPHLLHPPLCLSPISSHVTSASVFLFQCCLFFSFFFAFSTSFYFLQARLHLAIKSQPHPSSHVYRTYISPLSLSLSSQDYVSQDLQLLLWLSFCFCVCLCVSLCRNTLTHTHTFLRLLNTRENTGVKQYLWRLFVNALSVLCYFLTIFFS